MAQADQQIQNATGSDVRADLNNNFDALFSNNSGAAEPSVTTAFMWWADTNNDQLKIRNAADSAFITVGTLSETNFGFALKASPAFTGNVGVQAGSVSSLSVRISGDEDTGFYSNNANDFSIATGGTRRAHFDTNGITIRDRKALRFRDSSNSNFVALRAPSNAASDITLTLPSSDGNANDVLQSDGSGNLSFTALPQAVPTGSVHMMATTTVPSGYLKCNGAAIDRTTYADLFAVIGTTHGAGNGSSTFNVPDLRGEFVRGWDDSRGVDSGRNFGTAQSHTNAVHNHVATATTSISPSAHNHVFPGDDQLSFTANNRGGWTDRRTGTFPYDADSSTSGGGIIYRTSDATLTASTSVTTATSGSSEARPRNIAMMYVIKT
jgi:microcystin-dependent protein